MQTVEVSPLYNGKVYTLTLEKWQLDEIRQALVRIYKQRDHSTAYSDKQRKTESTKIARKPYKPKLVISDNATVYIDDMLVPKISPTNSMNKQVTYVAIPNNTVDLEYIYPNKQIHKLQPISIRDIPTPNFVLSGYNT